MKQKPDMNLAELPKTASLEQVTNLMRELKQQDVCDMEVDLAEVMWPKSSMLRAYLPCSASTTHRGRAVLLHAAGLTCLYASLVCSRRVVSSWNSRIYFSTTTLCAMSRKFPCTRGTILRFLKIGAQEYLTFVAYNRHTPSKRRHLYETSRWQSSSSTTRTPQGKLTLENRKCSTRFSDQSGWSQNGLNQSGHGVCWVFSVVFLP